MHDLQHERAADVSRLMARLLFWNASRVETIHMKEDPAGAPCHAGQQPWLRWKRSLDALRNSLNLCVCVKNVWHRLRLREQVSVLDTVGGQAEALSLKRRTRRRLEQRMNNFV